MTLEQNEISNTVASQSADQGRTLMVFTVITIVFVSFLRVQQFDVIAITDLNSCLSLL